jgi:hypothetical protein
VGRVGHTDGRHKLSSRRQGFLRRPLNPSTLFAHGLAVRFQRMSPINVRDSRALGHREGKHPIDSHYERRTHA